jgi:hypothetical protein
LILHELFLEYFVFAGNLFQDQFWVTADM